MTTERYIRAGTYTGDVELLRRVGREIEEKGFCELTGPALRQLGEEFPSYAKRQGWDVVQLEGVNGTGSDQFSVYRV